MDHFRFWFKLFLRPLFLPVGLFLIVCFVHWNLPYLGDINSQNRAGLTAAYMIAFVINIFVMIDLGEFHWNR